MPHLLVDITGHGYGHVSQTAPVVNALARRIPGLTVTVRSDAPQALLRQRFKVDFHHLPLGFDFGMKMANAVTVLAEASHAAYRVLHADWAARVAHEAQTMADLRPDLLLANVPYLSLAAARQAGIPAVALCSLNWSDIYGHYCSDFEGAARIHAEMIAAYASAHAFLRVQPAMPMAALPNVREIAPIAAPGVARRAELVERLRLGAGERCVLVAMGGMVYRLPVEDWPVLPGVRWLIPAAWGVSRADMIPFDDLGFAFSDLLASCDAVLTKPGYGTFAEASCLGVPVLYAPRADWPETVWLTGWLACHVPCAEVDEARLQTGALADVLAQLWSQPVTRRATPSGAEEGAAYLQSLL